MSPSIEIRSIVLPTVSNCIQLLTKYFHIVKVIHSLEVAQLRKIRLHHLIYLIDLEQWSVETQHNILICYEIILWLYSSKRKKKSNRLLKGHLLDREGYNSRKRTQTIRKIKRFCDEYWKYNLITLSDMLLIISFLPINFSHLAQTSEFFGR